MDLNNYILERYEKSVLEARLVEAYQEQVYMSLLENFLTSICEDYDIYIDEDATIEDIFEALKEHDFSSNPQYIALVEAQTPAQKKAAKKRAKEAAKKAKAKAGNKPSDKKAKVEPKKKEAPSEKPEREAPKKDEPKSDKKDAGKGDKIEKLKEEKSKIREQIQALDKQLENVDGKKEPEKHRELTQQRLELVAQRDKIAMTIAKESGDDDRVKSLSVIAKAEAEKAKLYAEITKIEDQQKNESVKEAEEDPKDVDGTDEELDAQKTELRIKFLEASLKIAQQNEKDANDKGTDPKTHTEEIKNIEARIKKLKEKGGTATPSTDVKTDDKEAIDKAEKAVTAAQTAYDTKKAEVDKIEDPAKKTEAETALKNGEEKTLNDAKAELAKLKGSDPGKAPSTDGKVEGDNKEAIDKAEKAVNDAKGKVTAAQTAYDTKKAEIEKETDEAKKKEALEALEKTEGQAITDAKAEETKATEALDKLKGEGKKAPTLTPDEVDDKGGKKDKGPTEEEIAAAEQKVADINRKLEKAKSELKGLDPTKDKELYTAKAKKITTLENDLEDAEDELKALKGKASKTGRRKVDKEKVDAAKKKAEKAEIARLEAQSELDDLPDDASEEDKKAAQDKLDAATKAKDKADEDVATAEQGEEDTSEKDAEEERKKNEMIEKLEEQYETAKESYSTQIDDINKAVENAREKTNSILSKGIGKINIFCWMYVRNQRLENESKFLEALIKMIPNPEKAKDVQDRLDKVLEDVKKAESDLEKNAERGKEKAEEEDPDALKKAQAKAQASADDKAKREKFKKYKEDKAERQNLMGAGDTGKKEVKDGETADDYKVRMAEDKVKAISVAIQQKEDEISKEEDPKKKAGMEKGLENIKSNYEEAKKALEDLKEKASESTDTDWWTFNAMIAIVEQQLKDLDDNIFPING